MREQDLDIARRWVEAFNAHDVEALVDLYAEEARHTSPKIRALHPETGGAIVGKAALRAWWKGALERLPDLHYEPFALTADDERVFLEYFRTTKGEPPMPVAEVFVISGGLIVASRVYHG